MTVLGAILAGGQSSRFGSDKALAALRGRSLLDHAQKALAAQCDEVIVIGRRGGVPDWPRPGLGPLGGVAGALHYAIAQGHGLVLTCGVDSVGLRADLISRLSPAPAYVADQPVIGLWSADVLPALAARLSGASGRSMRAFANDVAARGVALTLPLANVNTPDDLARLEQQHGL